jgi:hypothetical protein
MDKVQNLRDSKLKKIIYVWDFDVFYLVPCCTADAERVRGNITLLLIGVKLEIFEKKN